MADSPTVPAHLAQAAVPHDSLRWDQPHCGTAAIEVVYPSKGRSQAPDSTEDLKILRTASHFANVASPAVLGSVSTPAITGSWITTAVDFVTRLKRPASKLRDARDGTIVSDGWGFQ